MSFTVFLGNLPVWVTADDIRSWLTAEGLVTTRHCCIDLDGGGPSDDALLVIGVPPDRVVMAAIYEERDESRPRQGSAHALRLR